jgi:hypothetical protein
MSIFSFFKSKSIKYAVEYKYFALLDNQTHTLLVVGKSFQLINFLREYIPESALCSLPSSTKKEEVFFNSLLYSNNCYLLKWDFSKREFIKNNKISDQLREKSTFSQNKYECLREIASHIEFIRSLFKKTIGYQEIIYLSKKLEAEKFKNNRYPENEILNYPYILQYAEYKEISFKESADAILLKATMGNEMLAKTEILRLNYFNKVKDATSKKDLDDILNQFLLDYNFSI